MPSQAGQASDIVVAGGGVLGTAAALLAQASGFRTVALRGLAPAGPGRVARIFTLNERARRLLCRLGVWNRLASVTAVRQMQLYGPAGAHLPISAREAGVAQLGHTVAEDELAAALAAALAASAATCIDAPLEQLEQGAGLATAAGGGRRFRAKLVIGADGRHSPTALAAGIPAETTYLEQSALVALATIAAAPNTAWQWLASDGLLALLPTRAGAYGIVWSLPRARAAKLAALAPAKQAAALGSACAQAGELRELGALGSFELSSQLRSPVAGRVALIGDSAHAFHPLAGQAISVSLGDLATLFAVLAGQDDPGAPALLARYRRLRRLRALATRRVTEGIATVLRPDGAAAPWLDLLMGAGVPFAPALVRLANAS